jgi:coenzyme PQQ synthesis protein D (PqqD)
MRLTLRPTITTVPTEDGMVLLDEHSGRYFQLNGTGAAITRELLDGTDIEETAARVAERYSVESDRVAADVATLVRTLREAGLAAP